MGISFIGKMIDEESMRQDSTTEVNKLIKISNIILTNDHASTLKGGYQDYTTKSIIPETKDKLDQQTRKKKRWGGGMAVRSSKLTSPMEERRLQNGKPKPKNKMILGTLFRERTALYDNCMETVKPPRTPSKRKQEQQFTLINQWRSLNTLKLPSCSTHKNNNSITNTNTADSSNNKYT